MAKKSKPMALIDPFAGAGRYDLALDDRASRTREWQTGIGPLWQHRDAPPAALHPYLAALSALNPNGEMRFYPGSPLLLAAGSRPDDRLIVNEPVEEDRQYLQRVLARESSAGVQVEGCDGWALMRAILPPTPRRGLLLIDPPFEAAGEFDRMREAVQLTGRKWATGVVLLWHPLTGRDDASVYVAGVEAVAAPRPCLSVELRLHARKDRGLFGSGLVILNPPFGLQPAIEEALPFLCETLAAVPGAAPSWRMDWLVPDR